MSVRIRFERIGPRHDPNAVKPRTASVHWRGRAIGSGGLKRHVMNVTDPLRGGELTEFMMRAIVVLVEMGGTEEEVSLALDHAEEFLRAHLPRLDTSEYSLRLKTLAKAVVAREGRRTHPAQQGSSSR